MTIKPTIIISALCVLAVFGLAIAHCGNCPGDKESCCSDGAKACCSNADGAKACPGECQAACCGKTDAAKTCPEDCQIDCCAAQNAPDFTLKDLDGKDVQLSKLKGKIVVLEWTNYDCPFVKAHYNDKTQTTRELVKQFKDKEVVWLTINSTHYTTADKNKEWAKKNDLKRTVLVDSDGKVGKLYQAKTTPHVFVIDKNGNLAYEGAIDNAPLGKNPEGKELVNYAEKAVSELLEGKEVAIPKTKPYGCSVKYAKK